VKKPKYPLEEIDQIKKKRFEEAEKSLQEKKEYLAKEQKKLEQYMKDLELIKQHKIRQMMDEMQKGTTSDQIMLKERYLKVVVEEKLKREHAKVFEQQKEVKKAQDEVEKARVLLEQRRQDVDKLRMHREDWEQEVRKELEAFDVKETDEIGTTIHTARKYKPGGK
jgi:NhaP-type Na+/H+ and K+/H+ antiporter